MRPGSDRAARPRPRRSASRVNPRLVYGRMTGWGQDGPLARPPATTSTTSRSPARCSGWARTPDRPQFPANLVGDFGGGSTYLVIGILAALLEARLSGAGSGRRRGDRRRHRPPQRDDARPSWPAGCYRESARRTCSTAACRSTTSTRPPTAGTWRSGALEPQFYDDAGPALGIARAPRRTGDELGPVRRAARAARRDVPAADPGRVGRAVRGHRRVRRAGPPGERGRSSTRTSGARGTFVEREGLVQPAPGATVLPHRRLARRCPRRRSRARTPARR